MTPRHVLSRRARPSRHSRSGHRHAALRGVAIAVVAVVTFLVSGAAVTYARMQGNIDTISIDDLVEGPVDSQATPTTPAPPNDPSVGQAVNILLLGSDQRDGANGAIGGTEGIAGMRSDTAIVLHISADRSRVELVSIPRDSLVDIPACLMSNGKTTKAQHQAMFNSAFATGWDNGGDIASAAACTWRTVEANTGVHLDDFVVVDFAGFQRMVDSVGGVDICIPWDMKASKANLDLKAGQQVLDGQEALSFARARTGEEGLGNGSDINRIGNQQRLLSAMVNQVLSQNVLTNPSKILSFLDAVTSSLTTDVTLTDAAGIAYHLRDVKPDGITFMTIPWKPAPSDKNRVVWTAEATTVWQRMAADEPIVQTAPETTAPTTPGAPTPTGSASAIQTPNPSETKVAGKDAFTAGDVTAVCSS